MRVRVSRALLSAWVIAYQYSNWLNSGVCICAADKSGQTYVDSYPSMCPNKLKFFKQLVIIRVFTRLARSLAREIRALVKTGRKAENVLFIQYKNWFYNSHGGR
jgi:hypothetical protein